MLIYLYQKEQTKLENKPVSKLPFTYKLKILFKSFLSGSAVGHRSLAPGFKPARLYQKGVSSFTSPKCLLWMSLMDVAWSI